MKVLWDVRWIRLMQSVSVLHMVFAVGPWTVIMPTVVLAHVGSTGTYGALLSAFAVGALGGALLGGRIRGTYRGFWAMLLLSTFGFAVFAPGLTEVFAVLLFAFAVGGIGQEACDGVKMAAMRTQIPEKYRGRAFAADFFFSFAALPVGQLLGAVVVGILDERTVLIVSGAMVVITSLMSLVSSDMRRFASTQSRAVA